MRLLGLRGAMLQLAAAALLFGAAGYACRAGRASPERPRQAATARPPLPLTGARRALIGQFDRADRWLTIAEGYASRGDTAERGRRARLGGARASDRRLPVGRLGNALFDHAGMLTPAARLAFARAIELAPDHPAPRFFFGLALARSGDRDGALARVAADPRHTRPPTPAGARWSKAAIAALEPQALGRASNGRSSASATAWWRILPPETLRPVGEMRVGLHRRFSAQVGELQNERQGRIVEREGGGPRDRAGHVGDAIMDDAVDLVDRIVVGRRRGWFRSSRPGRSRCRPARSRASSS